MQFLLLKIKQYKTKLWSVKFLQKFKSINYAFFKNVLYKLYQYWAVSFVIKVASYDWQMLSLFCQFKGTILFHFVGGILGCLVYWGVISDIWQNLITINATINMEIALQCIGIIIQNIWTNCCTLISICIKNIFSLFIDLPGPTSSSISTMVNHFDKPYFQISIPSAKEYDESQPWTGERRYDYWLEKIRFHELQNEEAKSKIYTALKTHWILFGIALIVTTTTFYYFTNKTDLWNPTTWEWSIEYIKEIINVNLYVPFFQFTVK